VFADGLDSFEDARAADIHAQSAEVAPKISDFLIGTWEIEYLDPRTARASEWMLRGPP
jgi:hypothetical protein